MTADRKELIGFISITVTCAAWIGLGICGLAFKWTEYGLPYFLATLVLVPAAHFVRLWLEVR